MTLEKNKHTVIEPGDCLLTCGDFASLIRTSKQTIFRLVRGGEIKPDINRPGMLRFRQSTVDEWIQQQG